MGVMIGLVGLALMTGPWFIPGMPQWARLVLGAFGLVLLLVGMVATLVTQLYRKTSADQAFVRTGMGGARVVLDAGTYVIPVVHRLLEVNLRTMKLGVNPKGRNALITRDNLRADVLAQGKNLDLAHGVYGDPRRSSAEVGQLGVQEIVNTSVAAIQRATAAKR